MGTYGLNHDNAWSTDGTHNGTNTITNGNGADGDARSNDGYLGTLVTVACAYGGTASAGVEIYVLREAGGSYEAEADKPWGFTLPATTSTTHRRTFWVPASMAADFKIRAKNPSGATVTVTVKYKQVQGVTA